jgi:hypothetical protein
MANMVSTTERTFTVTGQARLTLLNVSGTIDVQGVDGDTLSVTAVKQPGRGFDQTEIEMEQAAGAVRVATRYNDDLVGRLLGRRHSEPCRVDYTVRLPHYAAVELSFVTGPATIADLRGSFDLQSVAGTLELADLSGEVKIKTVSGPVRATRLKLEEPLQLTTVSGDVWVEASHLPGLRASTTSGDVHIASGAATGAYHCNSVSGDLHLQLPAGTQGSAHLSTLSGRLHSDLPGVSARSTAAATGVSLQLHSVSGNVYLTAADSNVAAPASPPPSTEDRLALLDRIARGELSVNDALKNLNP